MRRPTGPATVLLALSLLAASGCAVFDRRNTPLFNASEKHLLPRTQPARALSFPVTVPLSLAAVTVDLLVVHPAMELPRAYDETKDALWDLHWRDWKGAAFTEGAKVLPRVALTPVVFAGEWLGRSVVGAGGRGRPAPTRERETRDAALRRLRELAETRDRAGFLAAADNACIPYPHDGDCRKAECLKALDGGRFDLLAEKDCRWKEIAWRDDDPARLAGSIRTGDPAGRAAALSYLAGFLFPKDVLTKSPALLDELKGLAAGSDKALALQAIQLLGQCPASDGVVSILSGAASGADPVLAYHASKALKKLPKR
jgi:hypothetical protein